MEFPRAGTCHPRPSKKYEKPKENDYFHLKNIKHIRKTTLLKMVVGGRSPAQIPERIFLLKKIDKQKRAGDLSRPPASNPDLKKLSFPKDFNTFRLKIVVFRRFFILFERSPMTGAGSGRFPAFWKSMKFLTRNNTFQEKRQKSLGKQRF